MPKSVLNDYFSFTKKERVAVIVLILLIIAVFLLPYFIPEQAGTDVKQGKSFQERLARLNRQMQDSSKYSNPDDDDAPYYDPKRTQKSVVIKGELFYFDPNSLSTEGWRKLGLHDKTIRTIANYLAKGGRFRHKEDIGKIYGLTEKEVARLLPYIRFEGNTEAKAGDDHPSGTSPNRAAARYPTQKPPVEIVDINTADSAALIALPGIGTKLAARIVHFREKLGGFYTVDQLAEIYALPDSTYQQIRLLVSITSGMVNRININTADTTILSQHPYIRWKLANAIVRYREEHGNFKSIEDLREIDSITPDQLKKMEPYLTVN